MPILYMLETIFYKWLQSIETKQEEPSKWSGTICPKSRRNLIYSLSGVQTALYFLLISVVPCKIT